MHLPRPVRAVVFDMDGLLIDTEQLVFRCMQETALDMGRVMPMEVFRQMVGLPHVKSDLILADHYGAGFDFEIWREGIGRRFREGAAAGVALKTGVVELLDHLDAVKMPRAIATSSGQESVEHSLSPWDLMGRFDAFITRDVQTNHKPHPEPFLLAASALGVAPQDCLALEDSHNGIRSASSAGMMTVMVPDMLDATEEMHGLCIRIAADLHEVRTMLEAQAS